MWWWVGGGDSGDREEAGAGTSVGDVEKRCPAWDRALGRDSVTDGLWWG